MKAVILAGGVGSRMRPLTYVIPKAMLPIGGIPLLEHTIRYLKGFGVKEFIVCVAYLKNHITEYFKNGQSLDVKIEYAETDMPLGTGGQLKTVERLVDERFVALNGDIVTSLNVNNLTEFHAKHGGIGTIALKKFEVPIPYGHIELNSEDCTIRNFTEKPTFSFMANAGMYVFEPKILKHIPSNRVISIEREIFPKLLKNGEKMNGYYEEAYWADVGTLTDFERVDKELFSRFYKENSDKTQGRSFDRSQ